jgi:hypothetical protein
MLLNNLILLLLGLHLQCYMASISCCKILTLTRTSLLLVQDRSWPYLGQTLMVVY